MIKSSTVGFPRIHRHNRKILNTTLKRRLKLTRIDQKLTQVIKSNTAGFSIIHRDNSKILKRILKRPLKLTGIDQKRFPN